MTYWTSRWAGYAAIGWTLLYVASKVHFAVEGRIGVTGGPRVAAAAYRDYGPGEVAQAQWANAGSGLLIVLLIVISLLPVRRRLPRVALLVLLWACVVMAGAGAVGMLGGVAFTERGGAIFGGYCAVWAALLMIAAFGFQRRTRPARVPLVELGDPR
ncbi:hypothetical protein [Nonomuraea guangzhouensis]|uniref:DUF998 domain-containing protein n=1 Tax=Nonomuraea guangzhouensis TaxID=1291555 RepID=A0ABW4G9X3_9ACTN|nr:hypothetical protein [Nonomuraea guangzhouensis]